MYPEWAREVVCLGAQLIRFALAMIQEERYTRVKLEFFLKYEILCLHFALKVFSEYSLGATFAVISQVSQTVGQAFRMRRTGYTFAYFSRSSPKKQYSEVQMKIIKDEFTERLKQS